MLAQHVLDLLHHGGEPADQDALGLELADELEQVSLNVADQAIPRRVWTRERNADADAREGPLPALQLVLPEDIVWSPAAEQQRQARPLWRQHLLLISARNGARPDPVATISVRASPSLAGRLNQPPFGPPATTSAPI